VVELVEGLVVVVGLEAVQVAVEDLGEVVVLVEVLEEGLELVVVLVVD
jgi:hypothetical protein